MNTPPASSSATVPRRSNPHRSNAFTRFLSGGGAPVPRSTERRLAACMLVLTGLYLIVELGFNARLLDVVGGLASHDEVERIEVFGRLISGTALALLVLNLQLKKAWRHRWPPLAYLIRIPLVAGLCIGAMYHGQRALIDALVDRSASEDRHRAALLVPMAHLMTTQGFSLTGLALEPEDYRTPQGKTLLATFPLQALSVPELTRRIGENAQPMFEMFAETVRGTPERFHRDYLESRDALRRIYDEDYQEAHRRYESEISGSGLVLHQNRAWWDYQVSLKRKHRRLRPDNVPRNRWAEVRRELHQKGIKVPADWHPGDQRRFEQAVAAKVRIDALDEFHSGSRRKLGIDDKLEPGMSFARFLAHPGIQRKWRESLRLPGVLHLPADPGVEQLTRTVYDPAIVADARELLRERMADPGRYADGGDLETLGRDSYRALIVPPVALAFSLLGAVTHLFKCLAFAAKIAVPVSAPLYWGAFAVYMALMIALPLRLDNQVTRQPLFERLGEQTRAELGMPAGPFTAGALRWTAQFQPYFYPVNEFVRVRMLGGYPYGYGDAAGAP